MKIKVNIFFLILINIFQIQIIAKSFNCNITKDLPNESKYNNNFYFKLGTRYKIYNMQVEDSESYISIGKLRELKFEVSTIDQKGNLTKIVTPLAVDENSAEIDFLIDKNKNIQLNSGRIFVTKHNSNKEIYAGYISFDENEDVKSMSGTFFGPRYNISWDSKGEEIIELAKEKNDSNPSLNKVNLENMKAEFNTEYLEDNKAHKVIVHVKFYPLDTDFNTDPYFYLMSCVYQGQLTFVDKLPDRNPIPPKSNDLPEKPEGGDEKELIEGCLKGKDKWKYEGTFFACNPQSEKYFVCDDSKEKRRIFEIKNIRTGVPDLIQVECPENSSIPDSLIKILFHLGFDSNDYDVKKPYLLLRHRNQIKDKLKKFDINLSQNINSIHDLRKNNFYAWGIGYKSKKDNFIHYFWEVDSLKVKNYSTSVLGITKIKQLGIPVGEKLSHQYLKYKTTEGIYENLTCDKLNDENKKHYCSSSDSKNTPETQLRKMKEDQVQKLFQ